MRKNSVFGQTNGDSQCADAQARRATSGQSHTPGPWVAHVDMVRKSVHAPGRIASGPLFLIRVLRDSSFGPGAKGEAQVIANARLIAAAPEMLEALDPFSGINDEGSEDFPDETKVVVKFGRTTNYSLTLGDFRRASAAVAKAAG